MRIIPVQQCRSLDGWRPILIPSGSDPDRSYVVHVNPWGIPQDNLCECKGFQYRGKCRHQLEAIEHICGWSESFGKTQDAIQRKAMICPKCGGPTVYSMEVVEEDE